MIIQFFAYQCDIWNDSSGQSFVRLFGRTKNNKNVCVIDYSFKPFFWVLNRKKTDLDKKLKKMSGVSGVEVFNKKYLGNDLKASKVTVNNASLFDSLVKDFSKDEVREADIPLILKYLVEKKIQPTGLVEAEGEVVNNDFGINVDLVIKSGNINGLNEFSNKFRTAGFDIETNSKNSISYDDNITLISLVCEDFVCSYTWKKSKRKNVKVLDSEALMIKEFCSDVKKVNPDLLVGYNSNGFDIPFLKERARRLGVEFDISKDSSSIISEKTRRGLVYDVPGVAHIDLYYFISNIFGRNLKTDSYSLSNVCKELLGEDKIDSGFPADLWNENRIDELSAYCEQDVILVIKLFEKLKDFIFEISRLSLTLPCKVGISGFSRIVENFLISKKDDFNELAPNKPGDDVKKLRFKKRFEGAYVHKPIAGLYENIVQFDFRSMYPSIISAHNIGPDTLQNGSFSKGKKGLIPSSISEIINMRMSTLDILKKKEDPVLRAREQSLKILTNSLYGYLGYDNARWYCFECATEVTRLGREYIKKTIDLCKSEGLETVYGDTDSVFLLLRDKSVDYSKGIVKKINDGNPKGVELKFEDYYVRGLFVQKKVGGGAAKKKYALATKEGSLIIKGFASIRSDSNNVSRDIQKSVLREILVNNDVNTALSIVDNAIQKIRAHKVKVEDLAITTKLRRNVESYKSKGPHVKAAQKLLDLGVKVSKGSIISYVIKKGKGSIGGRAFPVSIAGNDYDEEYYVSNHLLPSVIEILESAGIDKESFVKEKQKSIFDF